MKCHISGLFTFSHIPVHVLSECVFVTLFTWLTLVASRNNLKKTFFNRSNAKHYKTAKENIVRNLYRLPFNTFYIGFYKEEFELYSNIDIEWELIFLQ